MKIENMKIEAIKPYPGNAKAHPRNQVNKIAQSIQEYGFQVPILLDKENVIITGHGRLLAAKKLKMESVPTVRMDHLTDAQVRAFRLMDNRSNESDWLPEDLANELKLLSLEGFDLELTGFDGVEIEKLFDIKEGLTDPDEVPEVPKVAIAKPGDIWLCGKHRIMAGDSTKTEDVERLMDGVKADMVFTDPPYVVDYEGVNNDDAAGLPELLRKSITEMDKSLKEGGTYYVCHPDIHAYEFIHEIRSIGWIQARPPVVLWIKDSLVLGRGDYHSRSEPILYGWKSGAAHLAVKDRTQDNVWLHDRPKKADGHPTMKPVELVARAINNSSLKGQAILDPFGGSGSTLIAAEQTGRTAYLMEIDCLYVQVILERWMSFTGEQAVLEITGQTFEQVKRGDDDGNV